MTVARPRQVGRAARFRGIGQPVVGERSREPEAMCGLCWFERGPRSVEVTRPGPAIVALA